MTNQTDRTQHSTAHSTTHRSHAIVIGGSMSGLVAARVLADHFDKVTILDRDRFPQGPEARKGVPQGRHIHLLLLEGERILDQLFPGFGAELTAAGAPQVHWFKDSITLMPT